MDTSDTRNIEAHRILYVPWTSGVDTFTAGEALAKHVSARLGQRPVVVAPTRAAVSAHKYLAAQKIVTERSGYVPSGSVVVAWCPTRKVMQKVVTQEATVVVLVEPAPTSFDAWAKLVGAYNVVTGVVMDAALTDASRKALHDIVDEGYNGWHDEIADTMTLDHLHKLDEEGAYDRAVIVQFAEMEGGFYSIGKLEKLLDRYETRRERAISTR